MPDSTATTAAVVFLAAVLTNNIVLTRFLGLCSVVGVSDNLRAAWGMGLAVTFVTTCTAVINHLVYFGVLLSADAAASAGLPAPLIAADLTHLDLLVYLAVIAAFVQVLEKFIEHAAADLHRAWGGYLPLITVNCAILGVSLLAADPQRRFDLPTTALYGLGSGVGYLLAICLLAALRGRLKHADVPKPLQGLGITAIVAGLMAMALLGLGGIVDL